MLARIRKSMQERDQGFTLIELLVVMIIIGILAAIAIPVFLSQRENGWDSAVKSDLKNAATAQETALTEAGFYVGTVDAAMPEIEGWKISPGSNYNGGTAKITVGELYTGAGAPGAKGATYAAATDTAPAGYTTTGATATGGFCLEAVSASGATWVYDSLKGGLMPAGTSNC